MSNSMPPLAVSSRAAPAEGPRSGIIQKAGHIPGARGSFMRHSK